MKQKIIAAMLAVCALAVTACNTIEGAGQDIKKAGSAIERSANKNR